MMHEDMKLTSRMLLRLHLFRLDCDVVGHGEVPRFTAPKGQDKERPCLDLLWNRNRGLFEGMRN